MGFFDLFDSDKIDSDKKKKKDWDVSVFDTDRFKNNGSGNWVDWEDVCTGESTRKEIAYAKSQGIAVRYLENL